MAKSRSGARQPLRRVRPGKESTTKRGGATRAGAVTTAAKRARGVGGPPHRESVRERAATRHRSSAESSEASPARPSRRAADATALYDRLAQAYPDAHCALDHRNAFELLVATILSAQCTDKRVNLVTPALFAAYPTPHALAQARQEAVEELIRSTGFFRSKAKNLVAMATALVELHGGEVPPRMDALTALPGVGRKTANVILGNAFGVNEGIVVDTHVGRLGRRLGLADADDPEKVEAQLVPLFPRERWTMLAHLLIEHGRRICDARKPRCSDCVLRDLCPSAS